MTTENDPMEPRTYGNWIRPRSPGLAGLGTIGTVLLFIGAIVAIICFMRTSFAWGLGVLGATGLLLAMGVWKDKHGISVLERMGERMAWWRRSRGKHTWYRSGTVSRIPWGTCQLPGILARTTLRESDDAFGQRFAVIEAPSQSTYTAVLTCSPEGTQLVDGFDIDRRVAAWGQFLAIVGSEPGIAGLSVTIEGAPDTGMRLSKRVEDRISRDAPPFATDVIRQVVSMQPEGSSQVQAYVAITWNAATRKGGRRRDADTVTRELAARLPVLAQTLEMTGAGAVRNCTAQDICEFTRIAYDPAVASLIEEGVMTGQTAAIRWPDTGPAATEETWDTYRHDSGVSTTWMMTGAPRGLIQSGVLSALLTPNRKIWRKRVTLLFRPIDPAVAAVLVEADRREAEFAATSSVRPSARDITRVKAARATANEEAGGAGLVNFGLLATATWRPSDEARDVVAAMDSAAAISRVQLRPCYGMQQTAFAACLPLGMQLERFLSLSAEIGSKL